MFRELTRKHKQLPTETCIAVLKSEKRGVLSVLSDNGYPYGMPMNHWYNEDDACIYFHCGNVGHRLEVLKKNNKVSFCTYDEGFCKEGQWVKQVNSVIVFGEIEIIDNLDKIIEITTKLSYKFTDDAHYIETEIRSAAHRTLLLKLDPKHICGKSVTEA